MVVVNSRYNDGNVRNSREVNEKNAAVDLF